MVEDKLHPLDAFLALLGAAAPSLPDRPVDLYPLPAGGSARPSTSSWASSWVLLVLEAARRVVGLPIVIVALVFIAYAFAGPYLPGQVRPSRRLG